MAIRSIGDRQEMKSGSLSLGLLKPARSFSHTLTVLSLTVQIPIKYDYILLNLMRNETIVVLSGNSFAIFGLWIEDVK